MKLLRLSEAASRYAYSVSTLRLWVAKGHLKAYRMGTLGHIRVDAEEIEHLLVCSQEERNGNDIATLLDELIEKHLGRKPRPRVVLH